MKRKFNKIRSSIGWNDPIDSLIMFAKITEVNGLQVLVEEKRRRTEVCQKDTKTGNRIELLWM